MNRNVLKFSNINLLIISILMSSTGSAQIEDSLLDQIKGDQSTLQNIDKTTIFSQVDKVSKAIMPKSYDGLTQKNNDEIQSLRNKLSNLLAQENYNRNELDFNTVNFDKERRDPFALTGYMLEKYSDSRSGSSTSFTALSNVKMPALSLKGLLNKEGEMIALLKVENRGVYLVRVGDTIGFKEGQNDHVMRIKSIKNQSIIVEAGNLGQVIVVR